MPFRAGVVAVVGRPNVGKSTLVNALVGQKVAIVSDKSQTTRFAVRGVVNGPDHQVVLTDTPGFHKPQTILGRRLNQRVGDAAGHVDVVLLVVDAAGGVGSGDAFVASSHVASHKGPKVCAVNKIDRVGHNRLVPQLAGAAELADFDHIVPVSALTGKGLDELRGVLVQSLPLGAPLFPPDQATDQPVAIRIAEIVREKVLESTWEEVPHSVAVVVEEIEDDRGLVRIECYIYVERPSQKRIVVGKGGQALKEAGTRAREELEGMLGSKVFLDLRVKVQKDWQRDPSALDRLGL